MNHNRFKGAWLTDIDDTLLRSGELPTDAWIQSLGSFLKTLKQHAILWAPVSGVALEKMGPRLLYRLPETVLSHVIYFGGEGSTKHYFDAEQEQWTSEIDYQRNLSDAQTIALIGTKRLGNALQNSTDSAERIRIAENILLQHKFNAEHCLIDEMEAILAKAGFENGKSKTYFRGGAISWMMLGDISVKHYQAEKETQIREKINRYAHAWLKDKTYLNLLGNSGVLMPYPHATRGIKFVLEGNEKARAAEDLIQTEGIPASSLLFVGNELYQGGNDNSVRKIKQATLLSVGVKNDPGVIAGGVGVQSTQNWMDWVENQLGQGKDWDSLLKQMPKKAVLNHLIQQIETEKAHSSLISTWHEEMSGHIPTETLAQMVQKYSEIFKSTRSTLIKLKAIEYELLSRLAVLEQYHYDEARKFVFEIIESDTEEPNTKILADKLKQLLLPELKTALNSFFVEQLNLHDRKVKQYLDSIKRLGDIIIVTPIFLEKENQTKLEYGIKRTRELVKNWEKKIDSLLYTYFHRLEYWHKQQKNQKYLLLSDSDLHESLKTIDQDDLYQYFKWLVPRLEEIPHLKDLDKPTIVLISGTSGVGKSTISKFISKTLGIPTSFSSDVTSRSVIRESFKFLLGEQQALETFPELYGSSFEGNNLNWFYTQSMLTMIGVIGSIDRLIKENVSAVIDGVALIPGTLPEQYFEKANIVWIIASIGDKNTHFERMGTRNETGVERGGSERYRQKFESIRNNHDRLIEIGNTANALLVNNENNLSDTLEESLNRVKDPFADRGLPIKDPIREKTEKLLQERISWEIQHNPL